MNANVKAKWIEALRSGEYNQTDGKLVRVEGEDKVMSNCCLGVLGLVCGGVVTTSTYTGDSFVQFPNHHGGGSGFPPESFLGEVGLEWAQAKHLAYMNDAVDSSFEQIADWIEENL